MTFVAEVDPPSTNSAVVTGLAGALEAELNELLKDFNQQNACVDIDPEDENDRILKGPQRAVHLRRWVSTGSCWARRRAGFTPRSGHWTALPYGRQVTRSKFRERIHKLASQRNPCTRRCCNARCSGGVRRGHAWR